MKIDIHCHTSKYSSCSYQSPENMVEKAIKENLDGVIITEHSKLWKKNELKELQEKYPEILILNGIEVSLRSYSSSRWTLYDILVYGLPQDYKFIPSKLSVGKILEQFSSFNCAFVLAHPFRLSDEMLIPDETLKKFQAIEVDSSKFRSEEESTLARNLAKRLSLPTITASDGHETKATGLWYIETQEFGDISGFVEILKKGNWKDILTEEKLENKEKKFRKEKEISEKKGDFEKYRKKAEKKKKSWWKFW